MLRSRTRLLTCRDLLQWKGAPWRSQHHPHAQHLGALGAASRITPPRLTRGSSLTLSRDLSQPPQRKHRPVRRTVSFAGRTEVAGRGVTEAQEADRGSGTSSRGSRGTRSSARRLDVCSLVASVYKPEHAHSALADNDQAGPAAPVGTQPSEAAASHTLSSQCGLSTACSEAPQGSRCGGA